MKGVRDGKEHVDSMISIDCIIVRNSNQSCFLSPLDGKANATDAMISGTLPEKHDAIRMESKHMQIRLFCVDAITS